MYTSNTLLYFLCTSVPVISLRGSSKLSVFLSANQPIYLQWLKFLHILARYDYKHILTKYLLLKFYVKDQHKVAYNCNPSWCCLLPNISFIHFYLCDVSHFSDSLCVECFVRVVVIQGVKHCAISDMDISVFSPLCAGLWLSVTIFSTSHSCPQALYCIVFTSSLLVGSWAFGLCLSYAQQARFLPEKLLWCRSKFLLTNSKVYFFTGARSDNSHSFCDNRIMDRKAVQSN